MGLKVHGSGSLCQTLVRISKTSIVCYGMEELITLHHGNFAILGKGQRSIHEGWAVLTKLQTNLSNASFFLDEMRMEHLGGNPVHTQECSMFFLE